MSYYRDDEGRRLPIRIDTTSNGEFAPQPLTNTARHANDLAHEQATDAAKALGVSRRRFLVSACGAASSLLAINRAFADQATGGRYAVNPVAAFEPEAALTVAFTAVGLLHQ